MEEKPFGDDRTELSPSHRLVLRDETYENKQYALLTDNEEDEDEKPIEQLDDFAAQKRKKKKKKNRSAGSYTGSSR